MALKSNLKKVRDELSNCKYSFEEMERLAFTENGKTLKTSEQLEYEYDRLLKYFNFETDYSQSIYNWYRNVFEGVDNEIKSTNNDPIKINTVKKLLTYLSVSLGTMPSFYTTFAKMIESNEFSIDYTEYKSKDVINVMLSRYRGSSAKEEYGKKNLSWEDYYSLAVAYFNTHGNIDIDSSFRTFDGVNKNPDGYPLGSWISKQRSKYHKGNLPADKKILLDMIKMTYGQINNTGRKR